MTGPRCSYLHTLAQPAGERPPPDELTEADADKAIDALPCGNAPGRTVAEQGCFSLVR